jgi:hypothetical protein
VVDITPLGISEFTFRMHGQKYSFLTTSRQEREGWLKAIKTETEAAKGKQEEIQGSEGYKKALEELSMFRTRHVLRVIRRANVSAEPAVAGASVAGAAAATTPSKKSDERATREENGTTKSKSRSLSRGKRGSIFDRLSGKKEEAKDETKDKKDEPSKDAEAPATEAANDGKCFSTIPNAKSPNANAIQISSCRTHRACCCR